MNHPRLERARQVGTALALMSFPPLLAGIFAVHPHLLAFKPLLTLDDWTGRFHGRPLVHAGHAVMTLAVPLLLVTAFHFAHVLRGRGAWLGWIGGAMAVVGAVILAADKGALCLVTSAFDRLPEAEYQALRPGLIAMHAREGWLALLWLLPLLPVGFAVQGVGLVREGLVGRAQGTAFIVGSLLLANPDIEALSLMASLLLTVALWPYGLELLRSPYGLGFVGRRGGFAGRGLTESKRSLRGSKRASPLA
jgi:hypothetical protein